MTPQKILMPLHLPQIVSVQLQLCNNVLQNINSCTVGLIRMTTNSIKRRFATLSMYL